MRQLSKLFLALVICVALTPVAAYADKGGHGHGDHDRDDRDKHHDRDRDRHHHDDDDDRDDHGRPKGWDKGKKTGWGNCNLPPGQAKKHGGCNDHDRDDRARHDRDHDRDDRHNTRTTHTWHGSTTTSGTVTTQSTTTTTANKNPRIVNGNTTTTTRTRRMPTRGERIQDSKN